MTRSVLSFFFVTLFALFASPVFAQTGDITGTVTDAESGETIPGVNIVISELDRGVAAGPDGSFTLSDVPVGTYILRASFVGYEDYEENVTVEANEVTTLSVEIDPEAVGLEEVVVTEYGGEQTAGELTGSIENIESSEVNDVPVQNTEGLLQGRVSGVRAQSTSGNPGGGLSITVRGEGSINAGDNPLYIVDGIQVSQSEGARNNDTNVLSGLNPSDIESIEVLKDAAAASIYGAQGASGVVLISTKSGREGPVDVSVNYEGGVRFQPDRLDKLGRDSWVEYQIDGAGEDYYRNTILPAFGFDPNTPTSELPDFGWQDWLYRRGASHSVGFSATGGDEDTQFYLSGDWEDTQGAAREVSYTGYKFNLNLNQQLTEDASVDFNANVSHEDMPGVCQDGFFINCPFYQAGAEEPPISTPFLEDGSYNPNTEQSPTTNPALILYEENRQTDYTTFLGSLSPTYNIASWLTLSGKIGIDWQRVKESDYENPIAEPADGGTLNRTFDEVLNMTADLTLNAERTFGQLHGVDLLLGTEYRREYEDDDSFDGTGFGTPLLQAGNAAAQPDGISDVRTEFRFLSYFGRISYDYDSRYIARFSMRADASSRFGADNRWGVFPSVSARWRLNQEEFFTANFVDDLSVRVGYGVAGNANPITTNVSTKDFIARGLYEAQGSYDGTTGLKPEQLANQNLSWEEKREINVGVDWSLWQSRLSGSLDLYRDLRTQQILNRPLPRSSGYNSITENIGELRNRGIDLQLSAEPIRMESFRWSVRGQANLNQNEVLSLTGDQEELDPGSTTPVPVGRPTNAIKTEIWAGVNPADGRPMFYDEDGNITYFPSEADRQFFDAANEDLVGGFGTKLEYEGLSLDVFFDFSYGGTKLPNAYTSYTLPFGEGVVSRVEDRWQEPGDVDVTWPRAELFNSYPNADAPGGSYDFYDNSYIRLKSISLGYSFSPSTLNTIGLKGARIYVTGVNLHEWTSFPLQDPEVSGYFEEASYPDEAQVNAGVQLDI